MTHTLRNGGFMEGYDTLVQEAESKLRLASHLLETTYPIVREPKLLISVLEQLLRAFDLTIVAVLEYEKHFKTLPHFGQTFEECTEIFRKKIVPKYKVSPAFLEQAFRLKSIIDQYRDTPTVFRKHQTMVIADHEFNIKTLTAPEVKKVLSRSKVLIADVLRILPNDHH